MADCASGGGKGGGGGGSCTMMHREVGKGEKRKYAQKSQVLGTLLPSILTCVSPSNSIYYEQSFLKKLREFLVLC